MFAAFFFFLSRTCKFVHCKKKKRKTTYGRQFYRCKVGFVTSKLSPLLLLQKSSCRCRSQVVAAEVKLSLQKSSCRCRVLFCAVASEDLQPQAYTTLWRQKIAASTIVLWQRPPEGNCRTKGISIRTSLCARKRWKKGGGGGGRRELGLASDPRCTRFWKLQGHDSLASLLLLQLCLLREVPNCLGWGLTLFVSNGPISHEKLHHLPVSFSSSLTLDGENLGHFKRSRCSS